MFRIQMLPADHGDCLWIEYGRVGEIYRVLIDGGTQHSFHLLADKIKNFEEDPLSFELFVITHVDADHIGGSLELLRSMDRFDKKIVFEDVWFNGWKHLTDQLGDLQGELVTTHLNTLSLPWNKAFGGRAVVIPDKGTLPVHVLPGGMRLTLLSPTPEKLNQLRLRWEKTITEANLILGHVEDEKKFRPKPSDLLGGEIPDIDALATARFSGDKTPANGSSIAFLAEFVDEEDRPIRCLFTGDAHADVLANSISRLIQQDPKLQNNGRLKIDVLKVSHHGSKNNISRALLDLLDCPKYLFSTSGAQFNHPDQQAVARIIKYGRWDDSISPHLFFNYRSAFNEMWDDAGLRTQADYFTEYSRSETEGLSLEL
jgi:hypothetical protein